MIGLVPGEGAVQVTVAPPSAAVAATPVGAAGAAGATFRLSGADTEGTPFLFTMKSM